MSRRPGLKEGLRATAIVIAVLAAIDPVITTTRFSRSEVALVVPDSVHNGDLASQVRRTLGKSFTVVDGPWRAATATVVVGDQLPTSIDALALPLFAVVPEAATPRLALEAVEWPRTAPLDGRVGVRVVVSTRAARGRKLVVALQDGALEVDRREVTLTTDSQRVTSELDAVPPAVGLSALRVTATLAGSTDTMQADAMVEITTARWPVLFHDSRPSWISTFARRAIERDRRFVVTSQTNTSRNISSDAGAPPSGLDEPAQLASFGVIVVGAPEQLTEREVAGLEQFMRQRGGQVVLLFDQRPTGAWQRLLPPINWHVDSSRKVLALVGATGDTLAVQASEFATPQSLPTGAIRELSTAAAGEAVVWSAAVGAGSLTISGALDAWRFRDPATSGFDAFWRTTLSRAAMAAPPPIDIQLGANAISPGDSTMVEVSLRDPLLRGAGNGEIHLVAELLHTGSAPIPLRLWPSNRPGHFTGTIRGLGAGGYRVAVSGGSLHGEAPLLIRPGMTAPTPATGDLLRRWVAATSGALLTPSQLTTLPKRIQEATGARAQPEAWHPMRSAWWAVAFALLLSGEWWLRRRRGLA